MTSPVELDRLAARVRAATRDGGLIETAQVKVLGLEEVRAAAGSRWPRMREHVREGSIKIIAAHIGPADAVIPCGDGFLVVFAEGAPEEMERRCTTIREALSAFYLGEESLATLRANVQRETASAASLAGVVSEAASKRAPPEQRTELQLGRFWPVWSARHRRIAAHVCAPVINPQAPRMGYTPEFLEKAAHYDDFLDLDLCLLEQACTEVEKPETLPIGVTVHASTMMRRKSRALYLDHLEHNAAQLGPRMFITIAEIVPGTPLISLTAWSNALRRCIARVALDLHHSDRALVGLATSGIWAAGCHLPLPRHRGGALGKIELGELDRWCQALNRQRISPFIHGIPDEGFLDLASLSDLAFATSEKLWPSQSAPRARGADRCIRSQAEIADPRTPSSMGARLATPNLAAASR